MKNKPKILFRADGNAQMGLGHVIRSLAFVEMVNKYFHCEFLIRNPSEDLRARILEVSENIVELSEEEDFVSEAKYLGETLNCQNQLIILDGYKFDTDYQKTLRSFGNKLICIDDINAYTFVSEVVINHAGGFKIDEYKTANYTKVLLGPSYALLREPFRVPKSVKRTQRGEHSIFICFGGADPKNDTLSVLSRCLILKPNSKYSIVIGSAYLFENELMQFIDEKSTEIEVFKNIGAEKMVSLMQESSIGITSPSTVSYEYLNCGGQLYLKLIADNQKRIFEYMLENKLASDFEQFSVSEVIENVKLREELFDGKQDKRLKTVIFEELIELDLATEADMEKYFDWANDKMTRLQSFNSQPIEWKDHQNWFSSRIQSEAHVFYKGVLREEAIGQVRFDLKENQAIINYSIDSKYRGLGFGKILLKKSIAAILSSGKQFERIVGFVKNENIASLKVFRNLRFSEHEATELINTKKFILECKK